MGKQGKWGQPLFSWTPKSLQMVTSAMKLKDNCSLEESYNQSRQHIKSRGITLPTKFHLVKAMVFPIVRYGYERWTIKKAECWSSDAFELWVLEKTLRIPLDCKEIQSIHSKGDQSWVFIGGTDAEAETPILWPPDVKNWLTGKYPDAEKDWRQEEKGVTEDEMVGWHHWLNGHELEQARGEGEGSVACCYLLGCKKSDMTEQLSHNKSSFVEHRWT